jgi:hypothetical protein
MRQRHSKFKADIDSTLAELRALLGDDHPMTRGVRTLQRVWNAIDHGTAQEVREAAQELAEAQADPEVHMAPQFEDIRAMLDLAAEREQAEARR